MLFTSCIKIFIPPVSPPQKKIMLVYQFYITFPLLIDYTQEISPYICIYVPFYSVNRPSFLDALQFHYLLYIVYVLDYG